MTLQKQENRQQPFSGSGLLRLVCPQHAHQEQQSTHHNGAIGNIERRPVVNANVEIQKVRYLAVRQTIPEITYGAAKD